MYLMIALIVGLVGAFLIYKRQVQLKITTLAGAPIMATGIVIVSVFNHVIQNDWIELTLFIFFLVSLLLLVFYLINETKEGLFYERHLENPITSFGIGTWIASISLGNVLISVYEPNAITIVFYSLNIGLLWTGYITWTIRNYSIILQHFNEYIDKFQGGLLLSTVATQSVVISGYFVFGDQFPVPLARKLIWFGLLLYIMNLILITNRYVKLLFTEIIDRWTNSNCIIHGALSITGVAISFAYPEISSLHFVVWGLVLLLFILVEWIELLRAFSRYRKYGWNEGFMVYSPTQWSRIFTFAMFLYFTERIFVIGQDSIHTWVNMFLYGMSFTIVLLFIAQWVILGKSLINEFEEKKAM
ncbi:MULTISPECIES: hypothetical protein [Allobacillus]|uniref:Voltage-dependent anion channel n=1 Tax=Allobacillus salarius TaxID=1955272 RepID=A0A556PBG8_9BACI|nr:hypothetical protein [Allobacillus salarius]TSJ61749.1 hypothetical protein FPQ13_11045 [Allobacillus salarius]